METDVFPVAARLVARPDGCISLCASPSVERDDEWACVVAIVRHDLCHVAHAVESEGVAVAYPSHVGLEHSHSCGAHLFYDVALQQCLDAVLRVKV